MIAVTGTFNTQTQTAFRTLSALIQQHLNSNIAYLTTAICLVLIILPSTIKA